MAFRIIADSCTDYPTTHDKLNWVERVALTIRLGGKEMIDDGSIDPSALFAQMRANDQPPTSACPSPGDFMEAYDRDDADLYVVTMSDQLSGSYASAVVAAEMMKARQPERNIHVFNTFSATVGEVAACLKVRELAEKLPFRQVTRAMDEFISSFTTLFVLEDLSVLRKAGRLSKVQSMLTSALRIKLVMGADPDGTISVRGKALSMERAVLSMVSMVKEKCKSIVPQERNFVITHCNCLTRAEHIADLVQSACGFKEVLICDPSGISSMYANDGGVIIGF